MKNLLMAISLCFSVSMAHADYGDHGDIGEDSSGQIIVIEGLTDQEAAEKGVYLQAVKDGWIQDPGEPGLIDSGLIWLDGYTDIFDGLQMVESFLNNLGS